MPGLPRDNTHARGGRPGGGDGACAQWQNFNVNPSGVAVHAPLTPAQLRMGPADPHAGGVPPVCARSQTVAPLQPMKPQPPFPRLVSCYGCSRTDCWQYSRPGGKARQTNVVDGGVGLTVAVIVRRRVAVPRTCIHGPDTSAEPSIRARLNAAAADANILRSASARFPVDACAALVGQTVAVGVIAPNGARITWRWGDGTDVKTRMLVAGLERARHASADVVDHVIGLTVQSLSRSELQSLGPFGTHVTGVPASGEQSPASAPQADAPAAGAPCVGPEVSTFWTPGCSGLSPPPATGSILPFAGGGESLGVVDRWSARSIWGRRGPIGKRTTLAGAGSQKDEEG